MFKSRRESPGTFKGLGAFRTIGWVDNLAFEAMITVKEISKNIRGEQEHSAWTRLSLRDIIERPPIYPIDGIIQTMVGIWHCTGHGERMLDCINIKIILVRVPEGHQQLVTIGSIILRLFSRILMARLTKACPINLQQRGFIRSAGCTENLKLLQLLIKNTQKEHRPLGVVFINLEKAFDTMSHSHIIMALRQKGVDHHIITLITNLYQNIKTCINMKNEQLDPIGIQIGVKQGDPMSSLLFNLSMDPLLCKLEEEESGYQHSSKCITIMAFVDDLVLLSGSWDAIQRNIKTLEAFCDLTGLRTQGEKCHGFYKQPTKDSCMINDCPPWLINDTPLNMIEPGSSEKYLGLRIGPWTGISKPELLEKVKDWLQWIGEAPLKLLQKVDILKGYAILRLIYLADQADVKVMYLETLDLTI